MEEAAQRPAKPTVPAQARSGLLMALALTPNHVGTGASEGVVDAPVFREATTRLPAWPGSGLKGAIRAATRPADAGEPESAWKELFGSGGDGSDGPGGHGILRIDDAALLALPVAADTGVMAWITSPWLLLQYLRACNEAGIAVPAGCEPLSKPATGRAIASVAIEETAQGVQDAGLTNFCLGDLPYHPETMDAALKSARDAWADHLSQRAFPGADALDQALQGQFKRHLAVVSDEAMRHHAERLELVARIELGADGNTRDRHLWLEEYLPEFTLMYTPWSLQPNLRAERFTYDLGNALRWVAATGSQAAPETFKVPPMPARLHIGGKDTVGKGRVRMSLLMAESAKAWLQSNLAASATDGVPT